MNVAGATTMRRGIGGRTGANRRSSSASGMSTGGSWARNRNAVRHEPKAVLGPVWHTLAVIALVLVAGLIFLTQSTKAANYDLAIADANGEIASLEAQRDALVVENAKLTAEAATEGSNEVAAAMPDAVSADFVEQ